MGRIPAFLLLASLATLPAFHASQLYTFCPEDSSNTTFRSNLHNLLSNLSSAANGSSSLGFYHSSSGPAYGLYLCRGDVDPSTCRDCVAAASAELAGKCSRGGWAVTWYDECTVRYSNASIFAQLVELPSVYMWNIKNITGNVTRSTQVLDVILAKVALEAASGSSELKFATAEANISESHTVYALGQCTPDLSTSDCHLCLQKGIADLLMYYDPPRAGFRILGCSCNIRYEIYPFYRTQLSPTLLYTYCPNTTNSAFRSNIAALLSNLSATANSTNLGFYNQTIGRDTPAAVYGLYLCRGDVIPATCTDCVATASVDLPKNCPNGDQAVILYDECMIRYSNRPFFGHLDSNSHPLWNVTENATPSTIGDAVMGAALYEAAGEVETEARSKGQQAGEDWNMFGTYQRDFNDESTLYMLGQCTPDLSLDDCTQCLQNCTTFLLNCCAHPTGGRVYYLSCNLRYQLYPFYQASPSSQLNSSLIATNSSTARGTPAAHGTIPLAPNKSRRHDPLIAACSVIGLVFLLLCLALWLSVQKRKLKAAFTAELSDIINTESLQMDFSTIRAATHNFSIDKKLGQGGFGSVYKGTLENGQDIAVKRLSHNSRQGIVEFKTEVLLVAKLQHRNLVKLLGFCVSGKEIVLVYEFLPNSSLDKILFDPTKRMSLNWETRFKIICGIAKGLMYLHEDSRLRVVHRDLKSSNILLDETMNPKISDFGLAKHFSVDQTQDVTDSIAGTYGYMAPEYLLMGHYSIKSDVYSFGILVLEVVSGQRNKYLHRAQLEEALLYRAWRFWHEGEPLKLVDNALGDNFSREDVIKCIHIGLLCIQESVARRPNMTSVVAALGGQSITLPLPSPPNFFNGGNPSSTISTSSGVGSRQGVSILDTSEISELHAR